MTSNRKTLTTRPEKIFLLDQVVQNFGVLEAAIVGDLYFWIAKGSKPWRLVEDYSELFMLNEKTIREKMKVMFEQHQLFYRKRTRMNEGYLGAYQYWAGKSGNSQTLLSIYVDLLNNEHHTNDFGRFEEGYSEIPAFQMLTTEAIEQTGNVKSAYLLCRLAWAQSANCQKELYFNSKRHFTAWTNLGSRTAYRHLVKLRQLEALTIKEEKNCLSVSVNQENSTLEYMESYQWSKAVLREEMLREAS